MSLGGLYILILLKVALLATVKRRDNYLRANCLAGLQSVAAVARGLDHSTSERIVGATVRLGKRILKRRRERGKVVPGGGGGCSRGGYGAGDEGHDWSVEGDISSHRCDVCMLVNSTPFRL